MEFLSVATMLAWFALVGFLLWLNLRDRGGKN